MPSAERMPSQPSPFEQDPISGVREISRHAEPAHENELLMDIPQIDTWLEKRKNEEAGAGEALHHAVSAMYDYLKERPVTGFALSSDEKAKGQILNKAVPFVNLHVPVDASYPVAYEKIEEAVKRFAIRTSLDAAA